MILLQYLRLDEGEYMGFGLSGDDERTKMVGGDVTIAWMDHATGKFFLPRNTLDYVLDCDFSKWTKYHNYSYRVSSLPLTFIF